MDPLLTKTLIRVVAFILTTSIGAIIFSEIERKAEKGSDLKEKLLERLREEMENKYNISEEDFGRFIKLSYKALSPAGPAWNYFDGLRFAFETLTTIGYGGLSPATSLGQALCIVFAILGIPITILAFQSVGEVISKGISSLIRGIQNKCFRREPCHVEAKCTAITSILMITMLLVGATFQMFTDEWTFLEGFYFWFITFTTIGYGDYIPGYRAPTEFAENATAAPIKAASVQTLSMVLHITWTTLGLCVVSSILNALVAFMENRHPCRFCTSACLDGSQQEGSTNNTKDDEDPVHMTYV